jgi:alginate O-acetyltransferase complex protein AlgJ
MRVQSESAILDFQSAPGQARPQPRARRAIQKVMAIVFVVTVAVPLIGACLKWDPVESHENRLLAKFPGVPKTFVDVKHFSDLALGYYRDHFGFRNALIRGLTLFQFKGGLAVDQAHQIIIGKDGWLFYPPGQSNMLADRNLDPFTSDELDVWQNIFERRRQWCLDHGMQFVVIIPPDKQTIYHEFMPDAFSRVGPSSRLDQLIDRLHETHSKIDLIDLRPTLLAAKKLQTIPIYFKTDTHWNDYAAWYSYPVLLDHINGLLGTHMVPQPASNFYAIESPRSGDLARYMDLYYEYSEQWPQFVPKKKAQPTFLLEDAFVPVVTTGAPHGPRAYIIHDSFGNYFGSFIEPHFSVMQWQWTNVLEGYRVLSVKPNIFIDEFLERMMYLKPPTDTPDVMSTPVHIGQ